MGNTRKIPLIITNQSKQEILDELKKVNFNINEVEISEEKRETKFIFKFKLFGFYIKDSFRYYWQIIKNLIKFKKPEPMLGGGGFFTIESLYGQIFDFATVTVPHGIAFNTIVFVLKKAYKFLKSKKKEYIVIISEIRQPSDCRIKIMIPNNLNDEDLDFVLYQAEELFLNLDNIRNYFGKREIIAKCHANYQWKIKFK